MNGRNKWYHSLALLFLVIEAKGQAKPSIAVLDKEYGLLGAHFEGDTTTVEGLQFQYASWLHQRSYRRAHEVSSIGKASIKAVYYTFFEGRLQTIRIQTPDRPNTHTLLDYLQGHYGRGTKSTDKGIGYTWAGSRVYIGYTAKVGSGGETAVILSVPMCTEEDDAKAALSH